MTRKLKFALLLAALLAVVLIFGLAVGSESLSFFALTDQQKAILFDIRMPRVFLGACVGASLAAAGAGLQALLRNPLAEP
ncbi:MAG TPA: iron chelate uptake ABC transporter family permease subunit, partial [Pyrinomonadaceae bacterium]|nr:iron chelate uptake ABC transporter family permease subunit [Pyrinomonadaceae bacterium]